MIRMRKEVPELGWGDFEVLETKMKGWGAACTASSWLRTDTAGTGAPGGLGTILDRSPF